MKSLGEFLQKIKATVAGLPLPLKILYTGSVLLLLGGLVYLAVAANQTEYATLYSGLSEEDMGRVVEKLKTQKIPYKIIGTDKLAVPKEQLHETRLAMASEGVLKGGRAGFELFDEQKLGSTEFVQKVNYQRALQGELARTINSVESVVESRVHLVLPEESLFKEDKQSPSAAVVLKLKPGSQLGQQQIRGIVNLISSSVQGLQDDKITIMSTDGQVIYRKNASDGSFMNDQQLEHKRTMEEEMRRKIETMLEQVVGANRVSTRVSLNMDFSRMQVTEESFDPDSSVIRSQQRSIESYNGKEPGPKGNPDVPVNMESKLLQNSPAGGSQAQTGTQDNTQGKGASKQKETVNYEINRISRQIAHSPGIVKRMSVAVIVDGPYEMKADSDGKMKPVFTPRSAEEMKVLEDLVKKAAGYDDGRGDQISVSNVSFAVDASSVELAKAESSWLQVLKENQKIIFNLLLLALVFFFMVFIVKPFMRKFQEMAPPKPEALPGPGFAPALPAFEEGPAEIPSLLDFQENKELSLRQQAMILVQRDPKRAVEIIRSWLREEEY